VCLRLICARVGLRLLSPCASCDQAWQVLTRHGAVSDGLNVGAHDGHHPLPRPRLDLESGDNDGMSEGVT
jgi:hypothetical protein